MTDKGPPVPSPRAHVEDHHAARAEDFLTALSPMSEPWSRDPTVWIYRGQANAAWELKARGVRDRHAFKEIGIDDDSSGWSHRRRVLDEMLGRFRGGLD